MSARPIIGDLQIEKGMSPGFCSVIVPMEWHGGRLTLTWHCYNLTSAQHAYILECSEAFPATLAPFEGLRAPYLQWIEKPPAVPFGSLE